MSVSPELRTELLAEFSALREEILARLRIRHQILTFTIIALGIILTMMQNDVPATISLVYPALVACLALGWAQNDARVGEIGRHIAVEIESRLCGVSWESMLHADRASAVRSFPFQRFSEIYAFGVFVGTEMLVAAISIPSLRETPLFYPSIVWNILAMALTYCAVRQRRARFIKALSAGNVTDSNGL